MRLRPSLLLLAAILVVSCSRGGFTPTGARLVSDTVWEDGLPSSSGMSLSLEIAEDGDYSFRLEGGGLSWEGQLEGGDGLYHCNDLSISPGALFPEGEYVLYVLSSEGVQESLSLTYEADDVDASASGSWTDSRGNSVTVL